MGEDALQSALGTCAQVIATLYIAIAVEVRLLPKTEKWWYRYGFVLLYGSGAILAFDILGLFGYLDFFSDAVWAVLNLSAISYSSFYFFGGIMMSRPASEKNGGGGHVPPPPAPDDFSP